MTSYSDEYPPRSVDIGCVWLRRLLGRPIRCQDCILPKCQYDMTVGEMEEVEERLKLIGHKSDEELTSLLAVS